MRVVVESSPAVLVTVDVLVVVAVDFLVTAGRLEYIVVVGMYTIVAVRSSVKVVVAVGAAVELEEPTL